MYRKHFLRVLTLLSILLVSLAISGFNLWTYPANRQPASDFYQRHPGWSWATQEHDASNYFLTLS